MRVITGWVLVLAACGGPQAKKESALVNEGSDTAATCCCKTIPQTAEKEIVPVYAMAGRMECSTQHGECVDDVQCNGQNQGDTGTNPGDMGTGNTGGGTGGPGQPPPPPDLGTGK